jgi:two-component system phosphate regulon sensor histidine kinase PhoR
MGTYEVTPVIEEGGLQPQSEDALGVIVLLGNARWFTKVRWIVIGVFIIAGLYGMSLTAHAGLKIPSEWLFYLAGCMIVLNTVFILYTRRLNDNSPRNAIKKNLWIQITADLMIVTVLVHLVGSTDTFIAFAYLFHIALACIFFPPRGSLLVTTLAAALYLGLIGLEVSGIWPPTSVALGRRSLIVEDPSLAVLFAFSAVFVWGILWYFISTLSKAVRMRDQRLSVANEQLMKADQEKTRQVLVTTHELKSPFSGIETNIQILKLQFWNDLPHSVRAIIDKIEARARTLRERISEILTLGDLKSYVPEKGLSRVRLKEIIDDILKLDKEKANSRNVTINAQISATTVIGNKQHLYILFSNLISNAIMYSYEGGTVQLIVQEGPTAVTVRVSDSGIGIREDALPHIFDEYYRTREGAKFNKSSTGLGLAMVKEIVQKYGMRMKVISEPGKGTTFKVIIPKKKELIPRGGVHGETTNN